MNTISKVQFGTLNDKRFYFCDGIVSLHMIIHFWKIRERKNSNIKTFIVLFKQKKKNFYKKKVK